MSDARAASTGYPGIDALIQRISELDDWFAKKGVSAVHESQVSPWVIRLAEHMRLAAHSDLSVPRFADAVERAAVPSQAESLGSAYGRHLAAIAKGLCEAAAGVMASDRLGGRAILAEAERYLLLATEARVRLNHERGKEGAAGRLEMNLKAAAAATEREKKYKKAQALVESDTHSVDGAAKTVGASPSGFRDWQKRNGLWMSSKERKSLKT